MAVNQPSIICGLDAIFHKKYHANLNQKNIQSFFHDAYNHYYNTSDTYHKESINIVNAPLLATAVVYKSGSLEKMQACYQRIMDFSHAAYYFDLYFEDDQKKKINYDKAIKYLNESMIGLDIEQKRVFKSRFNEAFHTAEKKIAYYHQNTYSNQVLTESAIEDYTALKSIDAHFNYFLANATYPLSPAIAAEVFRQQMIIDLLDDIEDIWDDLNDNDTSPILIRLVQKLGDVNKVKNLPRQELKDALLDGPINEQEICINRVFLNNDDNILAPEDAWMSQCVSTIIRNSPYRLYPNLDFLNRTS